MSLNVPEAEERARRQFAKAEPYQPSDPILRDFLALAALARELAEALERVATHHDLALRMGEMGGPGLKLPEDALEVIYYMRASIRSETLAKARAAGLLPDRESRCDSIIEPNDLQYRCTAPIGHAGEHTSGNLTWPQSDRESAPTEPPALPLGHPYDGVADRDYCYTTVPCEPHQDSFGTWCDRQFCGAPESAHKLKEEA